jgi:Plant transposon protein
LHSISISGRDVFEAVDCCGLKHTESVYRYKRFPGCIGCLDSGRWTWDLGSVANSRRNKARSNRRGIRQDAICDESLWILHAFFGCPESNNDINIPNCSPHFLGVLAGNFPPPHLRLILRVSSSACSIGSSTENIQDEVALSPSFTIHLIQKNMHLRSGRKQFGSRCSAYLVFYLSILADFTSLHGFTTSNHDTNCSSVCHSPQHDGRGSPRRICWY